MGNCYQSNCDPCTPDSTAINQLVRNAANYARQANTYSVNAENSATNAENSFLQFNSFYLGAFSTPPTTDNEGGAIQEGALYWNTTNTEMYVYQGGAWFPVNVPLGFDQFTNFTTSGTTNPRNLFNRLTDYVSVKDFLCSDGLPVAGDGIHDDTTGIRAAVDAANSIYFPAGSYRVTSQIYITKSDVTLFGDGNATIIVKLPALSSDSVFRIEGPGIQTPTTQATASFDIGSRDLFVSNSSIFFPNDLIEITSTEIFNGSTGISGYEIRTKGELSQVATVLGGQLVLSESAKDNYTVSGETITVRKYDVIKNIKITGLNFYGTGGGGSHTSANPVGPRAFTLNSIINAEVSNCSFLNFPRFACTADRVKNLIITNNKFLGYDVNDASNLPLPSNQWFTGFQVFSSENVVFSSNVGLNSRRSFDANSSGIGSVVCRNISIINNTSINCTNTVGTHACDKVTISGNVGVASGGIGCRGKNCVISNNIISARSDSGTGISVGPTIDINNTFRPDDPKVGHVVITDNILIGTWEVSILVRFSADSALISNNRCGTTIQKGIAFGGTRINNVSITNNIIRINPGSSGVGIFTQNFTNNPVTEFNSFIVKGNSIQLNGAGQAIAIAGGPKENPADNVIIADNVITGDGLRHIALVGTGADNNTGFFTQFVSIQGNICNGSISDPSKISGYARTEAALLANNNMLGQGTRAGQYQSNAGAVTGNDTSYRIGMRIDDTDPVPGGYIGKVCTQGGTTGTLSGVTGNISNGSNQLTVSSVADIQIGHYLSVAGSGLPVTARVTSMSGSILSMSSPATATVSGAAVTRTAPIFKDYGEILP
jgi:hypothetical protein